MTTKLYATQLHKVLEMVADSKNAVYLAQHAISMSSEALIKATTGKTTEEAMGIEGSSQKDNLVPFSTERPVKNERMAYFESLGEDPIKG